MKFELNNKNEMFISCSMVSLFIFIFPCLFFFALLYLTTCLRWLHWVYVRGYKGYTEVIKVASLQVFVDILYVVLLYVVILYVVLICLFWCF